MTRKYGPIGTTFAAPTPSSIALIERPFCSCSRQISEIPEFKIRFTTKPGTSAHAIGCLRIACANVIAAATVSGRGLVAFDDLDQRHDRGGVEVVEADDLLGPQRRFADLGDRQRGGVRGEDRVAGRRGVELGEDGLLDVHALGHGLDHEVDVAEARVGGAAVDAPDDLLDLRVALLLGQLAALDQFPDLARGHVAGLVEPGLHELVVDVLELHGDARGRDRLGDLAPHRPRAYDGCLEHEHAAFLDSLARR